MKLSESSKAVILLRKKFRTIEISLADNPKAAWAPDPEFMAHKLNNLWTKFNKIKAEHAQEDGKNVVVVRCTADEIETSKKRKVVSLENDANSSAFCEDSLCESSFQPLHIVSEWIEPETTTKRLTVAIFLPSGISAGQFSVRGLKDGCALEFSMRWHDSMVDLDVQHRKWLHSFGSDKIEKYYPKLIGFETFLKSYRSCSSDSIVSECSISLPFQVQTQISCKFSSAWSDNSARIVYVDLRGQEEHYGTMQDNNFFEIC